MVTTDWCLVFCCHQTPRLMSTSCYRRQPVTPTFQTFVGCFERRLLTSCRHH